MTLSAPATPPAPHSHAPQAARLRVLVAGGGIGGLAAALACARSGCSVQVHEQAAAFTEVGAGVQLGPNVTRRLQAWGLGEALARASAQPHRLVVRSALHGGVLAQRALGDAMQRAYGAPYLTVHRAALHQLLRQALQAHPGVGLRTGSAVHDLGQHPADIAIAADGLWSALRRAVVDSDTAPVPTGHLAYRALMPQQALPEPLRSDDVTVWLGPRLHAVRYPVRDPSSGELATNLVLVLHAQDVDAAALPAAEASRWDHAVREGEWQRAVAAAHAGLRQVLDAMPRWQRWVLHDRAPLHSAAQMARGRVALLGDAAHPMRPYLAQGAGMAIEDAYELERCLRLSGLTPEQQLQRYAQARWARNAQVQARSLRNGRIFHATGVVRLGRDLGLRLLGERLLDQPWLYRG